MLRILPSLVLSFGLVTAAQAACPDPTPASELDEHVDDAVLSFATLDEEGFLAASDALSEGITCLNEVTSAEDTASYHRVMGLRAFWDGNQDDATASFQAALLLEPTARLSNKIAPEGGPLATLYASAGERAAPANTAFRAPAWTTAYVNGAEATERPAHLPALIAFSNRDGVQWSAMVPADGALPETLDTSAPPAVAAVEDALPPVPVTPAPVAVTPTPNPVTAPAVAVTAPQPVQPIETASAWRAGAENLSNGRVPRAHRDGGGGKGGLIAATVASGVITAALAATSVASRMSFDNAPTQGKFTLTNGAYYGAIGAGALTAGLAGVTIVSGNGE